MKNETITLLLNRHSLRKTQAMQEILQLFLTTKHPITAEEICETIKRKTNPSTVYRIIHRFLIAKLIHEIHLSPDKKFYELTDRSHHHHLICVNCKKIVDIPCLDQILTKIDPTTFNFSIIKGHSFEMFGLCQICDKK